MKRSLGPYRLVKALGAGAAAEVYLAEDTRSGQQVALKLLHRHLTENAEQVRRFQQEAEWVSLLNHPNVLTIYAIGEIDKTHFMASEYVDGETLRHHILSEMPIPRVLDVAIGVLSALTAAHSAWIVHRDVKPENIMLGRDGQIKVLDFGLAKLTQPSQTQGRPMTRPGTILGTLHYLAPEQILGVGVDPRTDLWSLGVVLYEMITGFPPFDGPTNRELVSAIIHSDPPPMARSTDDLPPELPVIIGKALRKDVEERYGSAVEMLVDLEQLKAEY